MAASVIEYYKIILDISIAAILATVLILLAKKTRKQKTLTGYTKRTKDETYAGYTLLTMGIVVMAISILQLILLLASNSYSDIPFGLSSLQITSAYQTTDLISGQLIGYIFGIPFWLLIFLFGGTKIFTLGTNLLRGTQIKIIKKIRAQ
jgi:hypothetical protein